MVAASSFDRARDQVELDQHVVLRGMAWKDYEVLLAIRGDAAGVRLYYLDGEIELMSPTRDHEGNKEAGAEPELHRRPGREEEHP